MTEIAAGYFPDYDVQWDYRVGRRYKTKIKESVSGAEQRRRMFPTRESSGTGHKGGFGFWEASSDAYTLEERYEVAKFLDQMDGAFKAFYLWRRDRDKFVNYYVGDVAAASSIVIPFKDTTITAVTVANVSKSFTVTENVGAGGEARVNFTAGTQTGAVRVDLKGRERVLVRSQSDEVVESFIANVVTDNVVITLSFKQLR